MFTKLKLSSTRRNSVCFNKVQSAKIHPQLTKENSISEGNFYIENSNFKPNEFNHTMNWTTRNPLSGSDGTVKLSTSSPATYFTSSVFQPYITTINLYQQGDYDTPVIQATLPKPIKKSDKINTRFKIRLDI